MKLVFVLFVALSLSLTMWVSSCTPTEPNELDKLGTTTIMIKDHPFRLWIADDTDEQTRGLMFITTEQMAPLPEGDDRGMIFVFSHEQPLSFWMRNTIIPLDIAYLDKDGIVVAIHTMAPLDERLGQYASGRPAKYAIEVNADRFDQIGLEPGDKIEIPASLR